MLAASRLGKMFRKCNPTGCLPGNTLHFRLVFPPLKGGSMAGHIPLFFRAINANLGQTFFPLAPRDVFPVPADFAARAPSDFSWSKHPKLSPRSSHFPFPLSGYSSFLFPSSTAVPFFAQIFARRSSSMAGLNPSERMIGASKDRFRCNSPSLYFSFDQRASVLFAPMKRRRRSGRREISRLLL